MGFCGAGGGGGVTEQPAGGSNGGVVGKRHVALYTPQKSAGGRSGLVVFPAFFVVVSQNRETGVAGVANGCV